MDATPPCRSSVFLILRRIGLIHPNTILAMLRMVLIDPGQCSAPLLRVLSRIVEYFFPESSNLHTLHVCELAKTAIAWLIYIFSDLACLPSFFNSDVLHLSVTVTKQF
jgi:hypothetical protein